MAAQLAISAAQALQQNQAEQQSADAQNAQNAINRKAIIDQQRRDRMEGERQAQQEYERAASETNQYAKEAHAHMASLDTLLGEGGGGVTADRKVASMGIGQGQDFATLASNTTKQQASIGMGTAAAVTRGSNQLASIHDVSGPSGIGTLLQIGGAAVKYGTDMHRVKSTKI